MVCAVSAPPALAYDLQVTPSHMQLARRNKDYGEISAGAQTPRGELLPWHDHMVWVGDLNYRLELADGSQDKSPSQEVSNIAATIYWDPKP